MAVYRTQALDYPGSLSNPTLNSIHISLNIVALQTETLSDHPMQCWPNSWGFGGDILEKEHGREVVVK